MKSDLIKICKPAGTLLLFLMFWGCSDKSSLELQLDDEILKGPVQSLWTYHHDGKDSLRKVIKKELLGAEYVELSKDRRLLSIEGYDYEGKLYQKRELKFSKELNLVSDVAKKPSGQMVYDYQYRDGLILKKLDTRDNGQVYERTFEYDNQKKLVSETSGYGSEFHKRKYVYENGRLIQELWIDDQEERLSTSYLYDGETRQRRLHSVSGEIYRIFTSKYDKAGNEIELDVAGENKVFTWNEKRKFSKNAQLLQEVTENYEGKVEELYTYNDYGDCIHMAFHKNGELLETRSYEFEYDRMGNWIKKVSRYKGDVFDIEERKFVYF